MHTLDISQHCDNLTKEQVNAVDSYGRTALHYACLKRDVDAVKRLLEQGASWDIKDNQGKVPQNYLLLNFDLAKDLLAESPGFGPDTPPLNEALFEKTFDLEQFKQTNDLSADDYAEWVNFLNKMLEESEHYQKKQVQILYDRLGESYFSLVMPDLLEQGFTLTEDSKKLFDLGKPGQGYVGIVNLEKKTIHLIPSFNSGDGLLRVDKNSNEFEQVVESRGILGGLGDLHSRACSILNMVAESGPGRKAMGFGIWKGGPGLKFVNNIPSMAGLIPNEYLILKKAEGYEILYVNQYREITPLNLEGYSYELRSLLKSSLPIDSLQRNLIEKELMAHHRIEYPDDSDRSIKYAKNRSTSQNSYTVSYTDAYSLWFRARNLGHTSHGEDLKRELPKDVFQKVMTSVTEGVKAEPIDVLTSPAVPQGIDGIREHLFLENYWNSHRDQAILEYAFFSENKELIKFSLEKGADLSQSLWAIVRYAVDHKNKKILNLLIDSAKNEAEIRALFNEILSRNEKGFKFSGFDREELCKLCNSITNKDQLFIDALHNSDGELASILLESGISPHMQAKGLEYAINAQKDDIVRKILVKVTPSESILQRAVWQLLDKAEYNFSLLNILLEKRKIALHHSNDSDSSFLSLAIARNWPKEAVELIWKQETDLEQRDEFAKKALADAIRFKRYELLDLILEANFEPENLSKAFKTLIIEGQDLLVIKILNKNPELIQELSPLLKNELIVMIKDEALLKEILAKFQTKTSSFKMGVFDEKSEVGDLNNQAAKESQAKECLPIDQKALIAEVDKKLAPLYSHIQKIYNQTRNDLNYYSFDDFMKKIKDKKLISATNANLPGVAKLEALANTYHAIKDVAIDENTRPELKEMKIHAVLSNAVANPVISKERDLMMKISYKILNAISIASFGIPLLINYAKTGKVFFEHKTKSAEIIEKDLNESFSPKPNI